jgi:quercetin dioxygenase-like cupin family protein
MYFYDPQTRTPKELAPGILARTFWGQKMLMAVVELEANSVVPQHSHPHEQVGILLEGEMELTIQGETRQLKAGEVYIIPGDVEHSARVGDSPAKAVDVFSPVREEYKF